MPLLETEGRFSAKTTFAELGESKNGTPFVKMGFETDEGTISRWFYLSDKAFPYSFKNLQEVFGFDGDFENLDQLVGKGCNITVVQEDDDDESRFTVKWVNKIGDSGPKLEEAQRKSLAQRLSQMAGVKKSDTEETEGDLPF